MANKIRVMVVDDLPGTRESVFKFLQFDSDIEAVGEAASGKEAIEKAKQIQPDVILMDVNMPDMDGIAATKAIVQAVPTTQIIIMSVQNDTPYLRQAMLAGARDFLAKPFSLDDLLRAIHEVYDRRPIVVPPAYAPYPAGQAAMPGSPVGVAAAPVAKRAGNIICIFSPKGGCGCTTIAVNLGVALAEKKHRTLLIDGSLQFGTVSVMLNMKTNHTLLELVERSADLDADLVSSIALTHESGLKVLLAPARPEMSELVKVEHIQTLFPYLRQLYDFIIVDTSSNINEVTLAMLDQADRILLVTEQTLPSLKTARDFLNLSQALSYKPNKVMLTVNQMDNKQRVSVKDISNILKRPVVITIPIDSENANRAADQGKPLVTGANRRRPIANALRAAATKVATDLEMSADGTGFVPASTSKPSFLDRLFGRK